VSCSVGPVRDESSASFGVVTRSGIALLPSVTILGIIILAAGIYLVLRKPIVLVTAADGVARPSAGWPWTRSEADEFVERCPQGNAGAGIIMAIHKVGQLSRAGISDPRPVSSGALLH
jgi:hypothetical protein